MQDFTWWGIVGSIFGTVVWLGWIFIKYVFLLSLAAMPFVASFEKDLREGEAETFYRGPGKRMSMAWLPIAGSAVMAAVAALPVGFATFRAEEGAWSGEDGKSYSSKRDE